MSAGTQTDDATGSRRARLWRSLLQRVEARLPALTRLRQPEALPIAIGRRRIYVLPTGFGMGFGGLLAVLTLGALNYDNNPALILGFLLASAAHTGLLQAYLALRGLRLLEVDAEPVHAGETIRLLFRFDAEEARQRRGLRVSREQQTAHFAIAPGQIATVAIGVPTRQRGWMPFGRISVSTRRPLGMFVTWSWLHPDPRALVYPTPEALAPPLPRSRAHGAPLRRRGPDEEVHGLRDYRPGDPLRTIAWKRSAQLGRPLVREFEVPLGGESVLDWQQLGGLDHEARIRRLTRWVLEAERLGLRYELRLPGWRLGPDQGRAHRHACLARLALMPGAER